MAGRFGGAGVRMRPPQSGRDREPELTAWIDGEGVKVSDTIRSGLEIRGVSHAYRGTPALRDVSFDVAGGRVVALLGPSGCGKSTILRAIAGLIRPDRGVIRLEGRDLSGVPARHRAIGMVFQNFALFPHMTVAENVRYGLAGRGKTSAEIRDRVAAMLRLVRLESFGHRLPRELSGGQQQRVAVARALAVNPSALLLDEPFGALDRALRAELQDEFVRMQTEVGITTVMVTHDQEEAQTVADILVVMNVGRVEQIGTPEEIYDRPASLFVNRFMGHANAFPATVLDEKTLQLDAGATLDLGRPVRFRPKARVVVTCRPEHVSVVTSGADSDLPATWIRSAPVAQLLSVDLILGDGTVVKALVDRRDAPRHAPGASVALRIDPARLLLFPAEAEASEAPPAFPSHRHERIMP